MQFDKVIKNLVSPKIETPLSRLYGYTRDTKDKIQIVGKEAKVIKEVITALATRKAESVDKIIDDILQQFFLENIRNRSGKNWTRQSL